MKIAILTSEYVTEANWHGGLANYLSRAVDGLVGRGHEIHLFVYSNREEVVRNDKIVIHRIFFNEKYIWAFNLLTFRLFSGFAMMLYIAYKFRKYFIRVHKKEKYDIVHSASCQTPALFLSSKKINIPIVTRLSSVMKLCQIAYNRKNKLDMFLVNKAEKFLIKRSDRVFAPSKLVKKKVKEEFGVEIDVIEPPEYCIENKKIDTLVFNKYLINKNYILFYGTLGRLKGSEFIASVIYELLSKNKDLYFVIIGKMEILKKRTLPIEPILDNAKEHKKRIIYLNSLVHTKLLPIIKGAKAVLLPSMIDNLPNTCIESMSLGKIVVGTYDGGFDQIIKNEENGFVVNYGDKNALVDVINNILEGSQEEIARMETQAKKTMNERLNFKDRIVELEIYYKSAINESKNKR